MMDRHYIDTVRLLLDVLPDVFDQPKFAIKGGTAINLFVEDMPRLSVDIDVVYTDHLTSRPQALEEMAVSLSAVQSKLVQRGLEIEIPGSRGEESKLFARRNGTMIKVEVNHVFRGTVMNTDHLVLSDHAQELFALEVSVPSLSPAELYGSKLVAAMDRQHPRDIFDVYRLYQKGGLSDAIVECFVCYLSGHNRPVHEVLFANRQDIESAFKNEFQGMTTEAIGMDELLAVRDRLWHDLPAALTVNHRNFLSGLVEASPDWSLMTCGHLSELPAIRWKLRNLLRLKEQNREKFEEQSRLLRDRFGN